MNGDAMTAGSKPTRLASMGNVQPTSFAQNTVQTMVRQMTAETSGVTDKTLPKGTQKVTVTPYTGKTYKTYRNIYDGAGNLISSKLEATSVYKARNQVIARNP